ncbi:SAM-dependent methyltransferase [Candidatus Woesearchaeota archaeon CG_4_10_14_0_8_um_filter_47_5]|nr:MAG: SAM-dependent methyltransferase [Candidatus Woesearchaeota archaeon CG_4_10_14_0_8_um_filter_47_5]
MHALRSEAGMCPPKNRIEAGDLNLAQGFDRKLKESVILILHGMDVLYRKYAWYYDLIYAWKDYKKEAETLVKLIAWYKRSPGNTLLDVACGTGRHLLYLKKHFQCTGIDCSEEMIHIARRKVRGVAFRTSDMRRLETHKPYDVITCLFGSIGYVKTLAALKKTLTGFSASLVKGGVAVVEPWFTPSDFEDGKPSMSVYEDKELKIARLNVSCRKGKLGKVSVLDMHYLIAERGKKVKHLTDHHELGLFTREELLLSMREAGFRVHYRAKGLMKGRGLVVGVKK